MVSWLNPLLQKINQGRERFDTTRCTMLWVRHDEIHHIHADAMEWGLLEVNPLSLTRNTTQWWWCVAIGAMADVSAMLATFLPMKSIYMLAANSVPGFFPRFLVDGGPTFAAVALVLAAGVLAAVARALNWIIESLDARDPDKGTPSSRSTAERKELLAEARRERHADVSILLIGVVTIVVLIMSVPYWLITMAFIGFSALTIGWRVSRRPPRAPYTSGADELAFDLKKWLSQSSLWSMAGTALATLLLAPPTLGITAILIAAIFGRRLVAAVGELTPILLRRTSTRLRSEVGNSRWGVRNRGTAQAVTSPVRFFTTEPGARLLRRSLENLGSTPSQFALIGQGLTSPLSAAVSDNQSQHFILRVFNSDQTDTRDSELTRHHLLAEAEITPAMDARGTVFVGFPTIQLRVPDDFAGIDPHTVATAQQIAQFQVGHERTFAQPQHPGAESKALLATWYREVEEKLEKCQMIPGPHRESAGALREMIPALNDWLQENLRPTLVPERSLNPQDFALGTDGSVLFLGGANWIRGHQGDAWSHPDVFASVFRELAGDPSEKNSWIDAARAHAETKNLERALSAFRLFDIQRYAKSLSRMMP